MLPLRYLLYLNPTEKIILVVRHHWFIFFKKFLKFLFLALVGVGVWFILVNFLPTVLTSPTLFPLIILAGSYYYLFIWAMFFYDWVDYYLDLYVVTSQEIIMVKQVGLFNREVVKHSLNKVQDVMSQSQGFFPTFFRYGDVHIQTAGAVERVIFEAVPNPYKVADKINDLVKYLKK